MFFAGMFVGVGGLLLIGYLVMKQQEKETAKQLQEMADKCQDEYVIVNDKKEVEEE